MREKLIELLNQGADKTPCYEECWDKKCNDCIRESQADHLIANGVTIAKDNNVPSKWIPVTESLPKPFDQEPEWSETVLFRTITGRIYSGYRNQGKPQTSFYDDDWYPPYWMDESEQIEVDDENVTHWMPLPDPPKGE